MAETGGTHLTQRSLEGKCLLVTGGAGAIGSAIARGLAAAGARVAIADLAADKAMEVAAAIGPSATGLAVEITDEASVDSCVEASILKMGGLHGLVHCAAIDLPTEFLKTDFATWEKTVEVNLTGAFLCCRAVARYLVKQRAGSLIAMACTSGERPTAGDLPYSASKAGLINLMQTIAVELAPCGVRSNVIAPGPTETPMFRKIATPEFRQSVVSRTMLKRLVTPEDVVGAAIFLLSDEASFVTGATLHLDGGLS